MIPLPQLLVGITGAFVGVIGWLFVGIFIQRRDARRRARNAARAVFFELGSNLLAVFTAHEYGTYGPLSRSAWDALLPELATWLPADELQSLALAYLGNAAYTQVAQDETLPAEMRQASLSALLDAHRTALDLLRDRIFTPAELKTIDRYANPGQMRLIKAATGPRGSAGSG